MSESRPRHAASTDGAIRDLLSQYFMGREDLSDQQRTELTAELLPVVWQAIRIKRPISRPTDFAQRDAARKQSLYDQTLRTAHQHGEPYTNDEIETLMRDDLTDQQIAEALGRSYYAVKTKRKRMRRHEKAGSRT